ncbi:MAG TPA: ABC transporter ATP-binding protein [Luteolibacter sp.]|nr:ABC transporter ATP-binding protein [Luteolibacter sp.]
MSNPVVSIENLSKSYIIGHQTDPNDGLRHIVERMLRAPGRLLRGQRMRSHTIEEFWALRDVSFEIAQGEVVGIIGRNGAGKSTLLKILSRITEPTKGRVRLRGRVASLLEVGTGFHPELTGRENVFLNGAILGMGRQEIRRKFDEIVAFADIEKFLDTPVKRYSSGMYVRLAFAVAAHLEPEILIIDEVLAVGDAAFQSKCLGKMGEVAKGGRTVLFVSHNMATVSALCSRAVMLRDGQLVANGAVEEVVQNYLAAVSEKAHIPPAERTDRGGTGEIITTGVELLGMDDQPLEEAISGSPVKLRHHFQCRDGGKFANCTVVLVLRRSDRVVCMFSTSLVRREPVTLCGEGFIDFRIDELPLPGGSYTVGVLIQHENEDADVLFGAYQMEVTDGDFFGTGRVRPLQDWSDTGALVRHSCEIHIDQPHGQRVGAGSIAIV